jgi:hypothetical protein
MMAVVEPIRAASDELIVIELPLKISQTGSGDAVQVILVAVPAGLVTIVGKARVRGVPN